MSSSTLNTIVYGNHERREPSNKMPLDKAKKLGKLKIVKKRKD